MKRKYIIIFLILILFIIIIIGIDKYRFNKCVKIETANLYSCENGEFGNYDCTTYENAEELCRMKI